MCKPHIQVVIAVFVVYDGDDTTEAGSCLFVRTQTNGPRTYLLVVENERVDGEIRQRVLHRLGRLDQLLDSGQLDALLHSLGRFSEKYAVLRSHANGESVITRTRSIGPALIFERLWQECGAGPILGGLLRDRHFEFPVERGVFLTVLQRLVAPGSDRAAKKWKQEQRRDGSGEGVSRERRGTLL